ncbi:GIY-YIG nuclease family protein [Bermanella sp. WJH001]|uniref:GIY-YIG nuclease family protein n=1 Tax=Bermanella sp. WJH001 TaxID=3048005 RepID=UPI0024BE38E3|nr:GIY-YIG nuclease family protein [Bermanella sp. WJH001]MDJ1538646.1 GIY-YIG nuclease family protein [Bermanella sp. WJH001]
MAFYVYILKCSDGSFYTGHTDNLDKRIYEHQYKVHGSCYTASRLPIQLVFQESFRTREDALASEMQIKGWGRKKKQALIEQDWDLISKLAKPLKK